MTASSNTAIAAARAHCPVCESDAQMAHWLVKSGIDLYRCAACDHLVVHPIPSPEALARLYSFEAGYQTHAANPGESDRPAHPKFEQRVDRIRRHREGGRLLDVGCSYGAFLRVARARGFDAQGLELSPDTAALARAQGFEVFVGNLFDANFAAGCFDIVHAGDVIEHLADPRSFVREIRRILAPGGLFVVATPNHAAFFPRATLVLERWLGIPWSHSTPPQHLHQFSTRSLTRLLAANGFEALDAYHTGVALAYELRATGSFSQLKRAVRTRSPRAALRPAFSALLATLLYPPLWLLDRAIASEREDATVNLIARARSAP